ncbi:hypothetical protein AAL_00064 [Moelleriella libera RCEF 2490]|uniref:Uncharacterized protein n=1 Tax=Moelleriella libera RCEF 2490 TaxID=1081109 RepID=A0A166UJ10_9HYPO|nr:hypothetical protein AAL_00064 [Moelleriella libera RCEF 2490]
MSKNGSLIDRPTSTASIRFTDTEDYTFHDGAVNKHGRDPFETPDSDIGKSLIPACKNEDVPHLPCSNWDGQSYTQLRNDSRAFWVNPRDGRNTGEAVTSVSQGAFETKPTEGDEIRARGPNRTSIRGTVQRRPDQYIRVRWPWMILPIVLVLLSTTFLVVAMARHAKGGTGAWKTSALPGLYHGLSGWEASRVTSSSAKDTESRTRAKWAVSREDQDGSLKLMRSVENAKR